MIVDGVTIANLCDLLPDTDVKEYLNATMTYGISPHLHKEQSREKAVKVYKLLPTCIPR